MKWNISTIKLGRAVNGSSTQLWWLDLWSVTCTKNLTFRQDVAVMTFPHPWVLLRLILFQDLWFCFCFHMHALNGWATCITSASADDTSASEHKAPGLWLWKICLPPAQYCIKLKWAIFHAAILFIFKIPPVMMYWSKPLSQPERQWKTQTRTLDF